MFRYFYVVVFIQGVDQREERAGGSARGSARKGVRVCVHACVCGCVCVAVGERERERGGISCYQTLPSSSADSCKANFTF